MAAHLKLDLECLDRCHASKICRVLCGVQGTRSPTQETCCREFALTESGASLRTRRLLIAFWLFFPGGQGKALSSLLPLSVLTMALL
ncbi:UNVERIFIED_CONTAM: hypothetical protein K2H54_072671, partial [Gekko kuhli]